MYDIVLRSVLDKFINGLTDLNINAFYSFTEEFLTLNVTLSVDNTFILFIFLIKCLSRAFDVFWQTQNFLGTYSQSRLVLLTFAQAN